VAPLVDPSRRPGEGESFRESLRPGDVLHTMSSVQLSNHIVGRVSDWIDPDAEEEEAGKASRAALQQELEWAAHLTVQACLLPPPTLASRRKYGYCGPNYAQAIVNTIINGGNSLALWLHIPLMDEESLCSESDMEGTEGQERFKPHDWWETWNYIRCACHHHAKLGIALEVGPNVCSEQKLSRWWGEPLKALLLRTDAFITNKKGYPTLPKRHQELLLKAFRQNVQIVVTRAQGAQGGIGQRATDVHTLTALSPSFPPLSSPSVPFDDSLAATNPITHNLRVYWEYISYFFRKQPMASEQEQLEASYRDLLQIPLQPLQDNLESQTYETFERDDTKYIVYGEAIKQALIDRIADTELETSVAVIMVVGAGRGPLVAAALKAATDSRRNVRIYAIEKNPNAVIHLHARANMEGWESVFPVTIVHADMRHWNAPEQADILVSELLGSFGDNELSPECIDGAQKFLKPDGISIPRSYTSYLQPITSHRLWCNVDAYGDLAHFETPYVVKLHRFTALASPQPVFSFVHPNLYPNRENTGCIDNNRGALLEFQSSIVEVSSMCHGFAGYFDAVLYGDIHLSTVPGMETTNMFSWFPIYFPIREPIYIPRGGAQIRVSIWRKGSTHKVWYEWLVDRPHVGPLHNPGGRSYYVGL
jgi:protein arginine N-methyltransferase 5